MKPNWRNICRKHRQIYTKENTTLVNNSAESRCEVHLWSSHIWSNVRDGQRENLYLSCWCRWISRFLMSSSSDTQRSNEVASSCIMQRAPFRLRCCRPPAASSPPCRQTFHKNKRNHLPVLWRRGKQDFPSALHGDRTKTGDVSVSALSLGCLCCLEIYYLLRQRSRMWAGWEDASCTSAFMLHIFSWNLYNNKKPSICSCSAPQVLLRLLSPFVQLHHKHKYSVQKQLVDQCKIWQQFW